MNKQKAAEVLINEGRGDGCMESLTQENMVTMKGRRRAAKKNKTKHVGGREHRLHKAVNG